MKTKGMWKSGEDISMKSEKHMFDNEKKTREIPKLPPIERLKRLKKGLIYLMPSYIPLMLIVFWFMTLTRAFYFLLLLGFLALIDVWFIIYLKNIESQIISQNLSEDKQEELIKKACLKFAVVSMLCLLMVAFWLFMSLSS